MTTSARPQPDTALHRPHNEQGQSPWLDDLRRSYLLGDDLRTWVGQGICGVTSNHHLPARHRRLRRLHPAPPAHPPR